MHSQAKTSSIVLQPLPLSSAGSDFGQDQAEIIELLSRRAKLTFPDEREDLKVLLIVALEDGYKDHAKVISKLSTSKLSTMCKPPDRTEPVRAEAILWHYSTAAFDAYFCL